MKRFFLFSFALLIAWSVVTGQVSGASYSLTANTNGNGGVSRNPSNPSYPQNSVVTLTATPAAGWRFDSWNGDIGGTLNPTNVLMDGNKTITAIFTPIPGYTLAVTAVGAGSVAPPGGSYLSNSVVSLTATPSNGWVFLNWSGDAAGTANPLNVTVNSNKTISALFVQPPVIVIQPAWSTGALGGSVTFSPTVQGTPPLSFQWQFNNVSLPGATAAGLSLTNLQPADGGLYRLIVSSPYGAITSAVAVLVVNCPGTNVVAMATDRDLRNAIQIGGLVRLCFSGTIQLTNVIDVTQDTTLDGSGVPVTVDGNNAVALFNVAPGIHFTVTNLSFVNGRATGANTGGAAIHSRGVVRLESCFMSNNVSVVLSSAPSGSSASGGAIWNEGGTLELVNCTLVKNSGQGGSPQTGSPGPVHVVTGGSIHSVGALTMSGCVASDNLLSTLRSDGFCYGGGVSAGGTVRITNCLFRGNACMSGGDFFSNTSTGMVRGGALFLYSGDCLVEATRFNENRCNGGRVQFFPGNIAEGGAIFSGGTLRMHNVTTFSNSALGGFGAPGATARGGGICSTGELVLVACAVINNTALGGLGRATGSGTYAGGHAFGGGTYTTGAFAATNVTFSKNQSVGADSYSGFGPGYAGRAFGGGCSVEGGSAAFMNDTLALNRAWSGYQGPYQVPGIPAYPPGYGDNIAISNGIVALRNSLLAQPGTNGNVWGPNTDAGYNFSSDGSAGFSSGTSFNFTDPHLLPLTDYGGPTPTMALAANSPAIDWAPIAGTPGFDQRGFPRPYGPGVDSGAFEAGPPVPGLAVHRSPGFITISFMGQAGVSYRIQRSTTLNSWETQENTGVLDDNGTVSRTYPTSEPKRFYRITIDF